MKELYLDCKLRKLENYIKCQNNLMMVMKMFKEQKKNFKMKSIKKQTNINTELKSKKLNLL